MRPGVIASGGVWFNGYTKDEADYEIRTRLSFERIQ